MQICGYGRAVDLQRDPTLAGRFVESYASQQLRPQVSALNGHAMHLRTGSGAREVDLLIETEAGLVAIEIKAGARPTADDAKHLTWLHNELGADLTVSLIAHTGPDIYPVTDQTWGMPLSLL